MQNVEWTSIQETPVVIGPDDEAGDGQTPELGGCALLVGGCAIEGTYDELTEWLGKAAKIVRLEYLRGELRAERISYGELAELQSLAEFIPADDLELREAAGLPEFVDSDDREDATDAERDAGTFTI